MSAEETTHVVEEKSYSELAIDRYLEIAELNELIELSTEEYTNVSVQCHLPKQLYGSIFVGHKATDLDSIASALGAAELFHGVAARASECNNETQHALKIWNIDQPAPYQEVLTQYPSRMTCIVDHNQKVQCPDHIDYDKLIGVIDHHAMQGGTVSTSSPIYVNIHPWGSACTIIATMFFQARRSMSRQTAGILLSGILSDTLNLRSPTTTEYDCLAVSLLSKYAKVPDVNDLARSLFKAKSMELLRCTPHQLVRGDLKTFECHCRNPADLTAPATLVKMAFGVIETTDVAGLVAMREKLIFELRALKAEEGKDLTFFAFVDIVNLNTELILVGGREADLAARVFNGEVSEETGLMHLKGRVSRKKDFIPPLEHYLSRKGWAMPELSPEEKEAQKTSNFGRVELECTEFGCQTVRSEALGGDDDMCADGAACKDGEMGEGSHAGHSHDHNKPLTAGALTRRLLSSYKLKGPHLPTQAEVQETLTFVLGGTTAHLTQQQIGNASPTFTCTIAGPKVNAQGGVKRTHSLLKADAQDVSGDEMVEIPALALDGVNVKRQKTNNDASFANGSQSPRSPKQLARALDIASDKTHEKTEELINELLAITKSKAKELHEIEEKLQLPSKEEFTNKVGAILSGDDDSLKFLLLAMTHAIEEHE